MLALLYDPEQRRWRTGAVNGLCKKHKVHSVKPAGYFNGRHFYRKVGLTSRRALGLFSGYVKQRGKITLGELWETSEQ